MTDLQLPAGATPPTPTDPQSSSGTLAPHKVKHVIIATASTQQDTITASATVETTTSATTAQGAAAPAPSSGTPDLPPPAGTWADMVAHVKTTIDKYHKDHRQVENELQQQLFAAIMMKTQNVNPPPGSTTDSTDSSTPPAPVQVTVAVSGTQNVQSLVVSNDAYDVLRRRIGAPAIRSGSSALQKYLHSPIINGQPFVLAVAVDMLPNSKNQGSVQPNKENAKFAVIVSYTKLLNGVVNDPEQSLATLKQLLPQVSEQELKNVIQAFNNSTVQFVANNQTAALGETLELPGYSNQVKAQATLVRTEQQTLEDPSAISSVVKKADAPIIAETNLSKQEADSRIRNALADVRAKAFPTDPEKNPPLETQADLHAAIVQAVSKQFPTDSALASKVAADLENALVDQSLGSNRVYLPPFNGSDINIAQTTDSIKNTIQKEFAKSDEAVHTSALADAVQHRIKEGVLNREFQNSLEVREAIKSSLIGQGIPETQAKQIAYGVDLVGLTKTGPLYNPNETGTLSPSDYRLALTEAAVDKFHVPPDSKIVTEFLQVSGADPSVDNKSVVAVINKNYRDEQIRDSNTLNPTPQQQIEANQSAAYDPASALVLEIATAMHHGSSGQSKPSSDIPV